LLRFARNDGTGRANAAARNDVIMRFQPSSSANGSAEWPPDDRLQRAIQYSEA
jgi:hypothetical protein